MASILLFHRRVAKVLLIDDDQGVRRALCCLLETDGHDVVGEATNGLEALDLLREGCAADVIVLDLDMPIMNGWQFLAALEAGDPLPPPVVVLSTHADRPPKSVTIFALLSKMGLDATHLCDVVRWAASRAR